MFVGKNPWVSHGIAEARRTLKEIANDPARSLVVIDPRRTETAELADFHLQVRPGTDAFCLAALDALIVADGHVDSAFVADRVNGADAAFAALARVPVEDFAERCGVPLEQLRAVARRVGSAGSVAVFEDLGLEQSPNSTLSSYLQKLIWVLTGAFGKRGSMYPHTDFSAVATSADASGKKGADRSRTTPVTGAKIIAGLVPCNSIVEEILTDHPDRFRALIVESSNPVHSLADSTRWREAMSAVDTSVVIDVAYTETARLAEYVLPAASQYEKAEMVFFNFEFPDNHVYLRPPVVEPLPGTLPEPEIHTRLVRALGALDDIDLDALTAAAGQSRQAFADAFAGAAADHPQMARIGPVVLYETLGAVLPPDRRGAAALWFLAHMVSQQHPDAVRAAGHAGEGAALGESLFDAILDGADGVVFTRHDWEQAWDLLRHGDQKITVDIPEMLDWLDRLVDKPVSHASDTFPFILSAGERRSFTANTIYRDPAWRKRDGDGALRMHPDDAAGLGVIDGGRVRITTAAGSAEHLVTLDDSYEPGHVALPNGLGLSHPDGDGSWTATGVAPISSPAPTTATSWPARHCTSTCPPASSRSAPARRRRATDEIRRRSHHSGRRRRRRCRLSGCGRWSATSGCPPASRRSCGEPSGSTTPPPRASEPDSSAAASTRRPANGRPRASSPRSSPVVRSGGRSATLTNRRPAGGSTSRRTGRACGCGSRCGWDRRPRGSRRPSWPCPRRRSASWPGGSTSTGRTCRPPWRGSRRWPKPTPTRTLPDVAGRDQLLALWRGRASSSSVKRSGSVPTRCGRRSSGPMTRSRRWPSSPAKRRGSGWRPGSCSSACGAPPCWRCRPCRSRRSPTDGSFSASERAGRR